MATFDSEATRGTEETTMFATNFQKRWRRTFALLTLAVLVGVGAAFAASDLSSASPAWATFHCTRYAPPTSPDINCAVNGSSILNIYCTNSVALRDDNTVRLAASRTWELSFSSQGNCNGTPHKYTNGTGQYGFTNGSDGNYWGADCAVSPSAVSGNCTTDWHS
jgi:hypothetical protein